MATTKKFYVVWSGIQPGIYQRWTDCEAQIKGVKGARYKSFPTLQAAEEAYKSGPEPITPKPRSTSGPKTPRAGTYITRSICVDAACSGNPGVLEYQGVYTQSKQQLFHQKFPLGTNNIGEFLGIVHGLAFLKQQGEHEMPIYSDSVNAIKWVIQKKCKTTLPENKKTASLYEVIRRAEKWLSENAYRNPILKWETDRWGEIPADFGRK